MAIVQVGTTQIAHGTATITTGALNTTGASLLIISVASSTDPGTVTPTDSNGNTWKFRMSQSDGLTGLAGIWYSYVKGTGALVTGAGHTVTWAPGGVILGTVTFSAFSGTINSVGPGQTTVDPFDAVAGQSGFSLTGTTPILTSGINAAAGSLVVVAAVNESATVYTINAPFTIGAQQAWGSGTIYGSFIAFATTGASGLIGAVYSANANSNNGNVIVSFLAADTTIAFDAAVDGGNNGGTTASLTWNHTVGAGISPLLVIAFLGDLMTGGHDDIFGVTYNGVSCSLITKTTSGGNATNRMTYVFMLANAPTGTHAVLITCANNHFLLGVSASYLNCGIVQVDSVGTSIATSNAAGTLSVTVKTVTPNDWVVIVDGGSGTTAGAGCVRRVQGAAFNEPTILDSNGAINPARSFSPSATTPGGTDFDLLIAFGIRPLVAPAKVNPTTLQLTPSTGAQTNQTLQFQGGGPGIQTQAAILSQGISNPAQLSILVSEALQNLQGQLMALFAILNVPPALQSIVLSAADIGTLNVGQATGAGQLNVYAGPPLFPQIGWVGINPPGSAVAAPVIAISSIYAGVVITVTPHNLQVNQYVQISGTSNPNCNGTFIVSNVESATIFGCVGMFSFNNSGVYATGGTMQRQFVGAWFQTIAAGGQSFTDAAINQNGFWVDENGIPHYPIQYLQRATAAVMLDGPNGSLTLNGFVWTSNSPAGEVSWSAGMVNYQNVVYSVSAGNTSATFYIYWQKANPTVFQTSVNFPALGADDFVVAENLKVGTTGVYSAIEELHDNTTLAGGLGGNGRRSIITATGLQLNNPTPNLAGSLSISGTAGTGAGILRLADGSGTGSLGTGQRIIATGSDGKIQCSTLDVNVNNSTGGNTFPNFTANGTATGASAGGGATLPATVAGFLIITIDGTQRKIPFYAT